MTAVPATMRLRRENTLRSRAARGDAAAFTAVYERHHQALYRYCRSILRHEEDAQDALQSTMARAFAALQDEQRDFELKPWLFRIAHNEAISILRKRRATASELDDIPAGLDLDVQVDEREQLRLLQVDLADLPERQRAALVLRELNGLSHAEIAVVLEMSAANVKQTIYEARTALFSAREGREMPCDDVRRMLSDGDGRVLRSRGVRAHLRSCAGCRAFRDDIGRREKRLALLAPPLPTAGAAALLAELLGGGTAKLLACVAIAGGGATVAATADFYKPPPRPTEAAVAKPPEPKREPARAQAPTPTPTVIPAVAAAATPTAKEKPAAKQQDKPKKRKRGQTVALKTPDEPTATSGPAARAEGEGRAGPQADPPRAQQPTRGKPPKADKPAKAEKPKREKPPKAEKPKREKPAQAKNPEKQQADTSPGPTAAPPKAQPPGQVNKEARGEHTPPGQQKPRGGDDEDEDEDDD